MVPLQVFIWCIAPILIIAPIICQGIISCCKKQARHDARSRYPTTSSSALEREVVFATYTAYVSRIQYISQQIAIGIIFYSFSNSIFIRDIGTNNTYIFNIVFHVFQFVSIQIFLKVSFGDPGIIRNKCKMEQILDDPQDNATETTQLNYRREYKHSFEPIHIDPDNCPNSFCWRCKFVRPMRSRHDYKIDACVAVFDHHSPTIGNAIGAYNRRYFVLLKLFDTIVYLLCIYVIIDLLIHNIMNGYSNVVGWIIIVLILLYISYSLIFPTLFTLTGQLYAISTNQTTYAMIHPQADREAHAFLGTLRSGNVRGNVERAHPMFGHRTSISFDKGCLSNWIEFLKGYEENIEYFYGYQCLLTSARESDEDSEADLP